MGDRFQQKKKLVSRWFAGHALAWRPAGGTSDQKRSGREDLLGEGIRTGIHSNQIEEQMMFEFVSQEKSSSNERKWAGARTKGEMKRVKKASCASDEFVSTYGRKERR